MKHRFCRKTVQIVLLLALIALLPAPAAAAAGYYDLDSQTALRVGLAYGSGALPTANLENASGSGYRFGFYDSGLNFIQLGYTSQTQISMLKSRNIYLTADNKYTETAGDYGVVGCFHIQLPGSYPDFESARMMADSVGGFVAWINGWYYVRLNSYASRSQADAETVASGYAGATVGETTRYGITVTRTGTNAILFQFDDEGAGTGLGVEPDLTGSMDRQTWFKGYRYRGGFRYQRADGNELTVVNVVSLGDYVKGVVPYEMSPSWPLEALKVQAVCARTYALSNLNKHRSDGFDLCNGTECQVYYGTNRENSTTLAAVSETAGVTVKYNGAYANTVFSASNGGASESAQNVWGGSIPYLQGVADPYEAYLANSIPDYHWSKTLTGAELQARLVSRGNTSCGLITAVSVARTDLGNVYSMTFTDVNGKNWTIYRETCRTLFGFRSQRFDLAGGTSSSGGGGPAAPGGGTSPSTGGGSSGGFYLNGERVDGVSGLYVTSGSGGRMPLGDTYHVITSSGTQVVTGGSSVTAPTTPVAPSTGGGISSATGSSFTFQGTGYGHNVGMSQWGANAMAQQGFSYVDILRFYYTGVTVGT